MKMSIDYTEVNYADFKTAHRYTSFKHTLKSSTSFTENNICVFNHLHAVQVLNLTSKNTGIYYPTVGPTLEAGR